MIRMSELQRVGNRLGPKLGGGCAPGERVHEGRLLSITIRMRQSRASIARATMGRACSGRDRCRAAGNRDKVFISTSHGQD